MSEITCKIEQIPSISAIYYALLQSGYEYYDLERSPSLSSRIKSFSGTEAVPAFFSKVRQSTCDVYPYWPRAYILETASFYLNPLFNGFSDYASLKRYILSAANIAPEEKDPLLWAWIADFPVLLKEVIDSNGFQQYLAWEAEWIFEQNNRHRDELHLLDDLLLTCRKSYHPRCQNIRIVLCPIKCVYSSDYHVSDHSFIFTSGDMRSESIVHEFMHTIIHPMIELRIAPAQQRRYPDIDDSYYLDWSEQGYQNAFEEYAVRMVTDQILRREKLSDLHTFLEQLAII